MHQDAPHLDKQYAAFGKVLSGMEVVDAICQVKTDRNDRPEAEQKMKSVLTWQIQRVRPIRSRKSSRIPTADFNL